MVSLGTPLSPSTAGWAWPCGVDVDSARATACEAAGKIRPRA